MKIETYLDEHGNVTDRSKSKFLRITSYDNETGNAIKTWVIRI